MTRPPPALPPPRPRVFLSHAWAPDDEGRDTHARAVRFAHHLKRAGLRVWIDDDQIHSGHVDATIADGIEGCPVFVALITRAYCNKVQHGLRERVAHDSCAKEWSCAVVRRRQIVPVIFEPSMRDVAAWPGGVVSLQVGGFLHVDASRDEDLEDAAQTLVRLVSSRSAATAAKLAVPAATAARPETPRTPRTVLCSLRRRSRRKTW